MDDYYNINNNISTRTHVQKSVWRTNGTVKGWKFYGVN